jgi:P27 family predicted phage terminase small subunit
MATRGRRPTPTALHKLRGTFNPTKHKRDRQGEPVAVGDLTDAPPDLTDAQQDIWTYCIANAPPGVVKLIDSDILKAWVTCVDTHNTARLMQARLDKDANLKLLIKGPFGLVESPYIRIMDNCAKTMIRLAQELGFSPAARPRLKTDAPADADADDTDPWRTLRLIPGGKTT